MPKPDVSNVFLPKNFDLFQIQPSLSVHFSGTKSFNSQVPRLLNDWFINEIFFSDNALANADLQSNYKKFFSDKFNAVFRFIPDVKSYLADHPDLTGQILRSRIFSGAQYITRQMNWGNKLFYFFGQEPEIIELTPRVKRLHLSRAEDIYRVYHLPEGFTRQDYPIINITDHFNATSGWIDSLPSKGRLIILRRYVLTHDDRLDKRFNFFEFNHLDRLVKIFLTRFRKRVGDLHHLYFDFDAFLTPAHKRNEADMHPLLSELDSESEQQLIRFWLSQNEEFTNYRLLYALFFHKSLKPRLDQSAEKVHYFISIDNPLLQTIHPDHSFVLRIDPVKFEPGTPYYLKTIIHLKRMESIRNSEKENAVPVHFGQFLNIGISFQEKYEQFNPLWLFGANHFHLECPYTAPILSKLKKNDPSEAVYLKWFSRLHQIGHFLKQGTIRTELLVLYPTLDDQFTLFNASIEELNRSGPDYTLVDLDIFASKGACTISGKQILFGKQRFYIVLLPAIRRLPLSVLEKLNQFVENGGTVLSIGRTPQECNDPQQESAFLKLNHQLWFKGAHSHSTSFKEFPSGGKTYFQEEISRLHILLADMQTHIQSFIQSNTNSVRYKLREDQNHYFLFIANTDTRHSASFEFSTRFIGRPYEWDFESGKSQPYGRWYLEDDMLYIKDELPAAGHLFLLINKNEGNEIWQIRQSSMKGIRVLKQTAKELVFTGHIRRPGYYYNILQRNKESQEIAVQVSNRLPILTVSSKNWYLDSEKIKGGTELGNYARFFPYGQGRFSYNKIIKLEPHYLADQQLTLQLGSLKDWCILEVNDQTVGEKFTAPWEFDITDFVQAGDNKISIIVVNNASNRLAKENDAFHVRDYGLFGPVKIIPAARFRIEAAP